MAFRAAALRRWEMGRRVVFSNGLVYAAAAAAPDTSAFAAKADMAGPATVSTQSRLTHLRHQA
jgi:hypothetical protein